MRAAIRKADDCVWIGQDLRHGVVVDIVLAVQPFGVEMLLDGEVEEAVDDALLLRRGDLADRLALEPLVLRQHRALQHHVVPPGAADADRRP